MRWDPYIHPRLNKARSPNPWKRGPTTAKLSRIRLVLPLIARRRSSLASRSRRSCWCCAVWCVRGIGCPVQCAPTYVAACPHVLTAVSRVVSFGSYHACWPCCTPSSSSSLICCRCVGVFPLLSCSLGDCCCVRGYPVAAGVSAALMRIGRRTHACTHIDATNARVRVHECVPTHARSHVHTDQHDNRYVLVNTPRALPYTHAVHTRAHARRHFHTGTQCSRPIGTRAPTRTSACARTVLVQYSYSTRTVRSSASDLCGLPQVWQRVQRVQLPRPHARHRLRSTPWPLAFARLQTHALNNTRARPRPRIHAQTQARRYARYAVSARCCALPARLASARVFVRACSCLCLLCFRALVACVIARARVPSVTRAVHCAAFSSTRTVHRPSWHGMDTAAAVRCRVFQETVFDCCRSGLLDLPGRMDRDNLPTGHVSVQMLDGAYVIFLRRHNFLGVGKEGGVEGLVSDKDGEPTSGFSLGAQCRTFPSMVIRAEWSDAVF